MRVRAIKDLMQLGEPAFFAAIAEGLELIVQNVSRLYDGALTLAKASQPHAASVLQRLAEEEASKVLILLDAVRCPRLPADRLSRQLARFNDHLAKGLCSVLTLCRSPQQLVGHPTTDCQRQA